MSDRAGRDADDCSGTRSVLDGPQRRVIVADDEPGVVEILGWLLSSARIEVLCARGGAEALALDRPTSSDLLILYLMMSDIDGRVALGPMEAKQQQACARIKANSWYLVSTIDEILSFSRAEAGRLDVSWEAADVTEIARDVARILRLATEHGRIALRFECGAKTPPLWTDPGKVRQILTDRQRGQVHG